MVHHDQVLPGFLDKAAAGNDSRELAVFEDGNTPEPGVDKHLLCLVIALAAFEGQRAAVHNIAYRGAEAEQADCFGCIGVAYKEGSLVAGEVDLDNLVFFHSRQDDGGELLLYRIAEYVFTHSMTSSGFSGSISLILSLLIS